MGTSLAKKCGVSFAGQFFLFFYFYFDYGPSKQKSQRCLKLMVEVLSHVLHHPTRLQALSLGKATDFTPFLDGRDPLTKLGALPIVEGSVPCP